MAESRESTAYRIGRFLGVDVPDFLGRNLAHSGDAFMLGMGDTAEGVGTAGSDLARGLTERWRPRGAPDATVPVAPRTPTQTFPTRQGGLPPPLQQAPRPRQIEVPPMPDVRSGGSSSAEGATVTPGHPGSSLSFQWGKDVKLGANGRPLKASQVFDPTTRQAVMDRSNVGGGGYNSFGGPLSEQHEQYLRNMAGDDIEEQARLSRGLALARDPFAVENAVNNRGIALEEAKTRLANRSRTELLQQKAEVDADFDMTMRDIDQRLKLGAFTPEQAAEERAKQESRRNVEYQRRGIPLTEDQKLFDRV
jgi:hypothetical protein